MPISAIDAIPLAFQHTKRQLIQPFRFWQWTRLAIVGLLAGEMSSGGGGGFNFPSNFNFPHQPGSSRHLLASGLPDFDPALLGGLFAVLFIGFFVLFFVFLYISSVMRFVLFDSVIQKECHIRESWSRRQSPGWKYFLWHLGLMLLTLFALAVLVGIPAAFAFAMGWFNPPSAHVLPLALGGILLFFVLVGCFITLAVVGVLTKDFVIPQMALEGIGAMEGWRRLWPMLQLEKSAYAIYIGMKIVLAIGVSIVVTIFSVILGLIIAIPTIAFGIIAVITGKTAGLTWNAYTITVAIVVGCVLFAILMYLISLISVPAIVFFPAYSIYFFAPRYRALSLMLYPPRPQTVVLEPPPLPPTSAPHFSDGNSQAQHVTACPQL